MVLVLAKSVMRRALDGAFGRAVRHLTAQEPRILMYHRFGENGERRRMDVETFEMQMKYLIRYFTPVRLLDVADALIHGRPLKKSSFVVTVDDGYEDFVTLAAPVLRRYGIPATVFVVSEFADQRQWLWYDALHYAYHNAGPGDYQIVLSGETSDVRLGDAASREAAWERAADALLSRQADEKRREVEFIARQLNVDLVPVPTPDYRAANWEQLRSLEADLFEIGGHTRTHAITSLCKGDELNCELVQSKAKIESEVGRPVRSFCYPNGQVEDYSEDTVRAVATAGYHCAVVAHSGRIARDARVHALPRIGAADRWQRFRLDMNGWGYLRGD